MAARLRVTTVREKREAPCRSIETEIEVTHKGILSLKGLIKNPNWTSSQQDSQPALYNRSLGRTDTLWDSGNPPGRKSMKRSIEEKRHLFLVEPHRHDWQDNGRVDQVRDGGGEDEGRRDLEKINRVKRLIL